MSEDEILVILQSGEETCVLCEQVLTEESGDITLVDGCTNCEKGQHFIHDICLLYGRLMMLVVDPPEPSPSQKSRLAGKLGLN